MAAPLHELEAQVLKTWFAEALRREADVKAGKSKMAPGNEALMRVRARIG